MIIIFDNEKHIKITLEKKINEIKEKIETKLGKENKKK